MEKPTWERGDSLRSLRDVAKTAVEALKAWIDRKDTEYANALNGEEDEYEQSGSSQAQSS